MCMQWHGSRLGCISSEPILLLQVIISMMASPASAEVCQLCTQQSQAATRTRFLAVMAVNHGCELLDSSVLLLSTTDGVPNHFLPARSCYEGNCVVGVG